MNDQLIIEKDTKPSIGEGQRNYQHFSKNIAKIESIPLYIHQNTKIKSKCSNLIVSAKNLKISEKTHE